MVIWRKICLFSVMIAMFTACMRKDNLLMGVWVQPIPGQEGVQGIAFYPEGKAASVNMHTLVYEHWKQEEDRLILSGKSIGNRQMLEFCDTFFIKTLTKEKLVLKRGQLIDEYTKATEIGKIQY